MHISIHGEYMALVDKMRKMNGKGMVKKQWQNTCTHYIEYDGRMYH